MNYNSVDIYDKVLKLYECHCTMVFYIFPEWLYPARTHIYIIYPFVIVFIGQIGEVRIRLRQRSFSEA